MRICERFFVFNGLFCQIVTFPRKCAKRTAKFVHRNSSNGVQTYFFSSNHRLRKSSVTGLVQWHNPKFILNSDFTNRGCGVSVRSGSADLEHCTTFPWTPETWTVLDEFVLKLFGLEPLCVRLSMFHGCFTLQTSSTVGRSNVNCTKFYYCLLLNYFPYGVRQTDLLYSAILSTVFIGKTDKGRLI